MATSNMGNMEKVTWFCLASGTRKVKLKQGREESSKEFHDRERERGTSIA